MKNKYLCSYIKNIKLQIKNKKSEGMEVVFAREQRALAQGTAGVSLDFRIAGEWDETDPVFPVLCFQSRLALA